MLRLLATITCIGLFAGTALAEPKEKLLTIRWFGQSFFQIETGDGTKIVIDPHSMPEYRPADV